MELNTVIEFDKEQSLFYLIDSNTDGSFLIHYLIAHSIRSNTKTFFVTLSQTLSHFKGVQAKLGNLTSFNSCLTNGSLINFDLMTKLSENFLDSDSNEGHLFDDVYEKIGELVKKADSKEKFYLIIDDLSIALLAGVPETCILEFLAKIQSLNDNLCLVVYIQSMLSNPFLISDLSQMSDLYFKIENLSTGYSKEIDGQISIHRLYENLNPKIEKYLYKVNERNVKLFQI
ncbi:unnamed protein product [Brachionus calyciflorus]|uniref:Elongator complex protein 6 n=1 Tax=Brachionus calyciflorus TaxID=104777 RepID=A0A813NBU4_9BILA|nr:unnamed protein product [Brachionus calyciflorus]